MNFFICTQKNLQALMGGMRHFIINSGIYVARMFAKLLPNGLKKINIQTWLMIQINIVLIPKCDHPNSIRDFRPIPLCNLNISTFFTIPLVNDTRKYDGIELCNSLMRIIIISSYFSHYISKTHTNSCLFFK